MSRNQHIDQSATSIQSLHNTNGASFLMTSHVRSALWTLLISVKWSAAFLNFVKKFSLERISANSALFEIFFSRLPLPEGKAKSRLLELISNQIFICLTDKYTISWMALNTGCSVTMVRTLTEILFFVNFGNWKKCVIESTQIV